MIKLRTLLWSSVAKKIISGVTGLCLIGFVIVHLLGNLALLLGNAEFFNRYSHFLNSFGWLIVLLELGLLGFFLFHIVMGIAVWFDKKNARPEGYQKKAKAGPPSRMTLSSRTMIITGPVLLVFLVIHVLSFKYGPGVEQGYVTYIHGVEMRDMYSLVVDVFQNEAYAIGYVLVMIFLGYHLRHGFWSAFQSLGINHPRWTPVIYGVGVIVAIILATGFLLLPVVIYFRGGAA
jgi:succinate dehydrogenase / fumarate reductase cytochrome b subunit